MQPILDGSILDTGQVPSTLNHQRSQRRIGVEIEFGGLYLRDAVELVTATFGGTPEVLRHNAWEVVDSDLGNLTVEIDANILQGNEEEDSLPSAADPIAQLIAGAEEKAYRVAGEVTSSIVPVEIVTAPLHIDQLKQLDQIINALRNAGAKGTSASILNGFGLHLNPEAASLDAHYITRMLRAFFILEDILWDDAAVNKTRALMPFISKFPEDYKRIVINPDYDPSLDDLIDDYLGANPTRNRDLDMLPMFAHINSERVLARVNDELIKARPTFHYRLPDCRLEDPAWGIQQEWRRWVCVEVLADTDALLAELSDAYLQQARLGTMKTWPAQVKERIHG